MNLDQLELLISRRLDGRLSPEEAHRLEEELRRHPDARAVWEQSARADRLAKDALQRFVGRTMAEPSLETNPAQRGAVQGRLRFFLGRSTWLIPGAMAAALLGIVLIQRFPAPTTGVVADGSHSVGLGEERVALRGNRPGADLTPSFPAINVAAAPTTRRQTVRDVVSVIGEDGNVYLLEIRHTWTIRRPSQAPAGRPVY